MGKGHLPPFFFRVAPFAAFIALLALAPFLPASPWTVIARGTLVAVLLAVFWRHYVELRQAPSTPHLALAVGVGLAVFVAWIGLDSGWTRFGEPREGFSPLRGDGEIDWPLAMARFLVLAAVVPVMEELFWRSFLMRWIDARDFLRFDPRQASRAAFALSSALFALEHSQWLAGLLAGLAYAWVYARSGNLWIPILAHTVTNGTLGIWILATRSWSFW